VRERLFLAAVVETKASARAMRIGIIITTAGGQQTGSIAAAVRRSTTGLKGSPVRCLDFYLGGNTDSAAHHAVPTGAPRRRYVGAAGFNVTWRRLDWYINT
jgi:hypothetical protein